MARVVGLVRLHDFEEFPELVIGELAIQVDGIVFGANRVASERIKRAASSCPKLWRYVNVDGKWSNEESLRMLWDSLKDLAPDWVVYPDEDELLPKQARHLIQEAETHGRLCVTFPFLECWNAPDEIMADVETPGTGPHSKIARYKEGLTFSGGGGFCFPNKEYADNHLESKWPLRHLRYVTPSARARRRMRYRYWWADVEHRTFAYDPDRTWAEWRAMAS